MKRREFITLLGGGATWPLAARAQQPGRFRLGILLPSAANSTPVLVMYDELRDNGFVEGQNLFTIPGGFEAIDDRLTERAAAVIREAPDAIVSGPELPLRALQALTRSVPLLGMTEDMVGEGLVQSLARPGGNVTGISLLSPELDGKRQQLLIEAVPDARRMGAMFDAKVTQSFHVQVLQQGARSRGVEPAAFGVSGPEEIAPALSAAKAAGAQAINFLASPLFSLPGTRNNALVLEQLVALRLPAIFQWPETAEAGGAIGYGPRFTDMYRQRARMVVKIFRGAKPADIPVEQPTRFELVINLKTTQAIGREVSTGLVLRADKVIE